jgi:plastocyanin
LTSVPRLTALGAALLLLSSCAGPGTPSSPSTAPSQTPSAEASATKTPAIKPLVLHIHNFAYIPAAPVVVVGQAIEIINDDVAAHTWSATPGSGWTYTSGNLEKGQQATFPGFTRPGTYKFLCYYHAEMPSMNGIATATVAP